ncbi:MAG TPA: hypothetical protein VHR88_07625 [Solirubrobacteraceae bacterium]|nr:hypothetical protein [Solirubrobacteraceae bacterium]
MPHVHAHAPHELTEGPEHNVPPPRAERRLEFASVLLLSLATLLTAWSGYQAALFSGEQSMHYAQANALRIHAQNGFTRAGQLRLEDLLIFNRWLDARDMGNPRLARIYQRRFRAHFVPAFRAWIAQHPFTNRHAHPSPLYEPNYRIAETGRAAKLDTEADRRYEEGTAAKDNDDKYILSTVFFAAVLFFSGISLRLDWRPLRYAVLIFGTTMLVGGMIFILTLDSA